jgi:hypothetical protein
MAIHTSIATPTADSYVSVASANTYFNNRDHSDAWLDITGTAMVGGTTAAREKKENLLKQATREIDRTYRFFSSKYYQGIKGESTYQFLEFPRTENVDANANLYIPDEVKYATYEQALWVMERTGKRTNEDGAVIEPQFIGKEAFNYIKEWVNIQIKPTGKYSWQGSNF